MMKRLGMLLCAILGHAWTDYWIDYQPDHRQRWERCHRCQTWTMFDFCKEAKWLSRNG